MTIYNDLKDNPNLFLMLCGHVDGEGQRQDIYANDYRLHPAGRLSGADRRSNGGSAFWSSRHPITKYE